MTTGQQGVIDVLKTRKQKTWTHAELLEKLKCSPSSLNHRLCKMRKCDDIGYKLISYKGRGPQYVYWYRG